MLAEHKDKLVGSYHPFLQMDGYATRIRERDEGKLVLSLLLIGSGKLPKRGNYVDAVLAKLDLPAKVLTVLQKMSRCVYYPRAVGGGFATCAR